LNIKNPLSGMEGILGKSVTISQIALGIFYLVVGIVLAILFSRLISKVLTRKLSHRTNQTVRRLIFYLILGITVFFVLGVMGVNLTGLLAAGGIVGLAFAFASQTSISNIISGLFLLGERPFSIGDVIKVGDTVGIVTELGLTSVKLRTFDNLFIRIPNENLLKSEIINITRYQIRRMDVKVSIAYKEYLPRAKDLLLKIAQEHPLVLVEPAPQVINTKLADSGIEIILRVWFYKTNYIPLLNDLTEKVKTRLDEAKIEIPFPHLKLYFDEEALRKMQFNPSGKPPADQQPAN